MNQEPNRKRGAPRGNQNARKHGFYSNILSADDRRNLDLAALDKGIDEEINLLRVKIKNLAQQDPADVRLISLASVSLARLLRTRVFLTNQFPDRFRAAITNIIHDIAIPLGISIINKGGAPVEYTDSDQKSAGPS